MAADLDVIHLKRFVAVVDCGGFAAAARHLNMTQQALSASIAQLENLTGVRFLERKRGSGVALTTFGRVLLERARTHLAMSDRLMREIVSLRDARGGSVTIGVGETMTGKPVAAAVARFNAAQPDVQLRLVEGYTEHLVPMLEQDKVDFVVGGASYALADLGNFEVVHLFDVADVLAVRAEHPLAAVDGPVELSQIADFPWLIPGARNDLFRDIQLAYARERLKPPTNIIRSDAVSLGTWLCLDYDYVICVSPDMIQPLTRTGLMRVLACPSFSIERHACLITRRHADLSPVAERLKNEILFEIEKARSPSYNPNL